MEPTNCAEPVWVANLMTSLPATIAAIAAFVAAMQLRGPVKQTRRRAEQLYNGEYSRGVAQGYREAGGQAGEFTQS